jgi:hypothetical protein
MALAGPDRQQTAASSWDVWTTATTRIEVRAHGIARELTRPGSSRARLMHHTLAW